MTRIGIIGGTNLFHSHVFRESSRETIHTEHGDVDCFHHPSLDVHYIPRHGIETTCPPHRVNHHAHISAMNSIGVEHILGITSVGSLKIEVPPGTLVIPDDFIQFTNIPTFFDDNSTHITPSLSCSIREILLSVGKASDLPIRMGGVYLQTTGPRFETKAEITFFSTFADLVGMNMASEATLANEMEIRYANLSIVDNYGNGISGEITYDEFLKGVRKNQELTDRFIGLLLPELVERL